MNCIYCGRIRPDDGWCCVLAKRADALPDLGETPVEITPEPRLVVAIESIAETLKGIESSLSSIAEALWKARKAERGY